MPLIIYRDFLYFCGRNFQALIKKQQNPKRTKGRTKTDVHGKHKSERQSAQDGGN